MTLRSDLRDAIIARVNTVDDIGIVHTYQRFNADMSLYLDQFSTTIDGRKQIRGWWITNPTIPFVAALLNTDTFDVKTEQWEFVVRGVMSVSDTNASDDTFGDLVLAVHDAIWNQINFGSTVVVPFSIQVSIPTIDIRQFGSILCHFAEIHVSLQTRIAIVWQ